ncbi:uracil-DNA glycosylase [Fodinibius saliphilus]|uniref:uracil-DNA glycosylase n=1 Tax=Fodinibius saliphilus TaxID=1920650 RepID=UPI0011090080|nr:uracil-DNA glycosylase [Fodinibius saliphilus]
MADSYPEDLINNVINFIEYEREVYGDFSLNKESSNHEVSVKEQKTDDNEEHENMVEDTTSNYASSESFSQEETDEATDASDDKKKTKTIQDYIDACNSLKELEALCKKADILRTDLEGTQLVFGVGNSNADLMLIGEAPGAEEDRLGEPFVGKAGQLLNKILAAIDFDRKDVYIANILKHRPPNNRNPKEEERQRSLPFLLKQIDLVNPKLILSLGKVSAQTLLNKNSSLSSMRGHFHTFRNEYELLATYHPAALLRHAKWKRPTWEDVKLLRKRYDEVGGEP